MAHRGRESADDRLAAELASGKTIREAATTTGVAERTAYRRLGDPAFANRVENLRSEMIQSAAGRLADGMSEAATVLRSLLASDDENVRHRAAVKLLELGLRVRDQAEIENRIATLERMLEDAPAGTQR